MWLALVSAILAVLALNTPLPFLVSVALAPFFYYLLRENRWSRIIVATLLFRLLFLFGTTYFVLDPLLYLTSILWFIGFAVSIQLTKKYGSLALALIALPFLWTLWDYLQARFTLLPTTMVMLGAPLGETSLVGLSRLGGIIGLTFFVACGNMLATALLLFWQTRFRWKILGVFGCLWGIGWLIASAFLIQNQKQYNARLRQLEIALIASPKSQLEVIQSLLTMPLATSPELVVIPETFYTSTIENADSLLAVYAQAARHWQTNLFAVSLRPEAGKLYKSGILFSPEGIPAAIYNKNHLTITSETWPFAHWRPWYLNRYAEQISSVEKQRAIFDPRYEITAGMPTILHTSNYSFAAPVCGELFYPEYLWSLNQQQPDFILHNTNNSWIKNNLAQYLRLTNRVRRITAVWLQKPVVVTGVADQAGVFYPNGEVMLAPRTQNTIIMPITIRF